MAMMKERTIIGVVVHKASVNSKIGLRLEDRKLDGLPKIVAMSPGGAAHASRQLKKGDVLVSINGVDARGHKRAEALLRQATGDVQLVIRRGGGGSVSHSSTSSLPYHVSPAENTRDNTREKTPERSKTNAGTGQHRRGSVEKTIMWLAGALWRRSGKRSGPGMEAGKAAHEAADGASARQPARQTVPPA